MRIRDRRWLAEDLLQGGAAPHFSTSIYASHTVCLRPTVFSRQRNWLSQRSSWSGFQAEARAVRQHELSLLDLDA